MDLEALHDQFFHRNHLRDDPQFWSQQSATGMVSSAHYLASAAGAEMLKRGGNAIDAAIATSYALGVCEPAGSGLGGMAMMVVHLADRARAITIEGPCIAPHQATPESVQKAGRYRGHAAIAVPTHVATMNHAHSHYATLPIHTLLEPAIQLAEQGIRVTATLHRLMTEYAKTLRSHPAGQVFLKNDEPYAQGDLLRQPALARTLKSLAKDGLEDFYVGRIGRQIVEDIRSGGGFIDSMDFGEPPWPLERSPLSGPFLTDELCTIGPPGGGMALIQLAQLLCVSSRESIRFDEPDDVTLLANMIRRVRLDRRKFRLRHEADSPGEADLILGVEHNQAAWSEILSQSHGSGETSHFCVVDRWGNAVAQTQSVERSFGSGVVTPDLGFVYNGYLRAFKVENRRHPHFLKPGAKARSNACPSMIMRGDRPRILIGSTGSERMVSSIFCALLRLQCEDPFFAVHGARLHCTPERVVMLESGRLPDSVLHQLSSKGFELVSLTDFDFRMGGLQMIVMDESGAVGVADPRRDGAAIGPDDLNS